MTGVSTTTVTDALGFPLLYQVDDKGRLRQQTFRYGSSTVASATAANVAYEYDDQSWNVVSYTDPRKYVYRITYDAYGNTTSVVDPLNNVTQYQWRTASFKRRLSTGTIEPVPGQVMTMLAQETDALGNVTTYTTDDFGNVTHVKNALQELSFEYANGLRTSATDANGNTTSYQYDDQGRGWLISLKAPENHNTSYVYDDFGNLKTTSDPLSNKTNYVYDRLGRLKQVAYADGTVSIYPYDAAGHLMQITDPAGAVTGFEYDTRGRVTKRHQYPNAGDIETDYTTVYEYDAVGNPIAVTDPRTKRSTIT
jgi:YD repeat-containing protein